jgi:hypothetical protein
MTGAKAQQAIADSGCLNACSSAPPMLVNRPMIAICPTTYTRQCSPGRRVALKTGEKMSRLQSRAGFDVATTEHEATREHGQ